MQGGLAYGAESTQGLFYHYFVQVPRAVRLVPAVRRWPPRGSAQGYARSGGYS